MVGEQPFIPLFSLGRHSEVHEPQAVQELPENRGRLFLALRYGPAIARKSLVRPWEGQCRKAGMVGYVRKPAVGRTIREKQQLQLFRLVPWQRLRSRNRSQREDKR